MLADGEAVRSTATARLDLAGVFVGSEGTLGIATEITCGSCRGRSGSRRCSPRSRRPTPPARSCRRSSRAGIVPAAVEMMDALTIQAAEDASMRAFRATPARCCSSSSTAPAVEVELTLPARGGAVRGAAAPARCASRPTRPSGPRSGTAARRRSRRWAAVSPDYYVQDGVVPRTRLPQTLRRIAELSARYGLRVGNVFHAGDGNLHPLVLYDAAVEGEAERAERLAAEILDACVEAGGSLTGEHGIGVDKVCSMPWMFSEGDLEAMDRLRRRSTRTGSATPARSCPTPRLCGEVPGPYRRHPLEREGVAERF